MLFRSLHQRPSDTPAVGFHPYAHDGQFDGAVSRFFQTKKADNPAIQLSGKKDPVTAFPDISFPCFGNTEPIRQRFKNFTGNLPLLLRIRYQINSHVGPPRFLHQNKRYTGIPVRKPRRMRGKAPVYRQMKAFSPEKVNAFAGCFRREGCRAAIS